MPQVQVEKLEPGTVIKMPETFAKSSWTNYGVKVPDGILSYSGGPINNAHLSFLRPEGYASYNWNLTREKVVETIDTQAARDAIKTRAEKVLKGDLSGVPYNYSSGCDPEVFVVNGKGSVVPATEFLEDKKKNSVVFYDGIQAEFAPAPGSCLQGLGGQIQTNLRSLLAYARGKMKKPSSTRKLTIKNTFKLSPTQLQELSTETLRFRCSESKNVYNDIGELPDAREYPFRFAGGHIHIGCGKGVPQPVIDGMVRALDGILGVAAVGLAQKLDTPERRRMYGRAGEYRLPEHGLEYRVLSNFWLCSPTIYHLTFELARLAYRMGMSGIYPLIWKTPQDVVRDCINWCDVQTAQKIVKENEHVYRALLGSRWNKSYHENKEELVDLALETILNGVEVVVKNPDDIENNWMCKAGWGSGPGSQAQWSMVQRA